MSSVLIGETSSNSFWSEAFDLPFHQAGGLKSRFISQAWFVSYIDDIILRFKVKKGPKGLKWPQRASQIFFIVNLFW
jgi:hypothetical protein